MASIVKRGKTYSVVYYEGEGSNRHQIWESGLSYSSAKSRKATIEYQQQLPLLLNFPNQMTLQLLEF